MATFRKLSDDSWGVQIAPTESFAGNGEDDGLGQNRAPVPGTVVTVTKRSGQSQQVTLGTLVSSHPVNGWVFKIAPRAQASATPTTQIGDLSGILALFERAKQHLRYPAIVLQAAGVGTIRISMAGDQAHVPGSLNVASFDEYVNGRRRWFGRVLRNGTFEQRDGGFALEDERSTAVGYGPVCADHFGLPWGERPTEFAAAAV